MKKWTLYLLILTFLLPSFEGRAQAVPGDNKKSDTMPLEVKKTAKMKSKIMSLVVEVKGGGNRFLTDHESLSLAPGRLIPSKGLFIVPAQSTVTFRPMPGVTMMIVEDSRLQSKELEVVKKNDKVSNRKALLFLNQGEVFVSIDKLNNKMTNFQIQTPQGIVTAKGTKFWVSFKGGKGKVSVVNGVVELKPSNTDKVTLKKDEVIEIEGIGSEMIVEPIRLPTPEERKESESVSQQIAAVEGVAYSATNPFLTTSEQIKDVQSQVLETQPGTIPDVYEEPIVGGSISAVAEQLQGIVPVTPPVTPNPDNTPPQPEVSPVVP